jgi:hypothetical protein
LAGGINDFGKAGLGWCDWVTEFQKGLGDGAGGGAREADDAYASAAGWGGDGYDGVVVVIVFENGHVALIRVSRWDFFGWGEDSDFRGFCVFLRAVFCGQSVVKCVAKVDSRQHDSDKQLFPCCR